MIFGTYKVKSTHHRHEDGRIEVMLTREVAEGIHTVVISYRPKAITDFKVIEFNPEIAFPVEIRIEGYGFSEKP